MLVTDPDVAVREITAMEELEWLDDARAPPGSHGRRNAHARRRGRSPAPRRSETSRSRTTSALRRPRCCSSARTCAATRPPSRREPRLPAGCCVRSRGARSRRFLRAICASWGFHVYLRVHRAFNPKRSSAWPACASRPRRRRPRRAARRAQPRPRSGAPRAHSIETPATRRLERWWKWLCAIHTSWCVCPRRPHTSR